MPSEPGSCAQCPSEPGYSDKDLREELTKQIDQTIRLQAALNCQKRMNVVLRKKIIIMENKFGTMLSKDQIKASGLKSKRSIRWGNDILKKAIQIRFATGSTGYKLLQDMSIPLPDIRTLQRRIQHIKMEPGVLGEVFDMLKLKVDGLTEMERECVLTVDEMSITPSVELHLGTGKLYGDVTLPGHTGEATHACVFMLAGSTTRWKQVVA